MASSNRHWPSMFKTKACNPHHPWHHDINSSIISNAASATCQKPPLSSGSEERSPEPKPRWNPRPEQIRILEAIFNSGTVNPSRDEIRKIRGQLQEYGQVGDANVFYWFQNRKSRSKHKQQRHLQKPTTKYSSPPPPPPPPSYQPPPPPLPLPISDKCTTPVNSLLSQPFHQNDFLKVPILPSLQGFSFTDHLLDIDNCSSNFLLSDLLLGISSSSTSCKNGEDQEKMMKIQQLLSYDQSSSSTTSTATLSTIHHTQCAGTGVGETVGIMQLQQCPIKSSIVFINDVEFEVTMARPFNVREAFGDDAILIHASGQPVVTNEWGVALEPLHHGGFYYLIRATLSPSSDLHMTTVT